MSFTLLEIERIISISLSCLIVIGLIYYLKVGKDRHIKKSIIVVLISLSVIVILLQLRLNNYLQFSNETDKQLIIQSIPEPYSTDIDLLK